MSGRKRFNTWRSRDRSAACDALLNDKTRRTVPLSAAESGVRRRFGCFSCNSNWRSTQLPRSGRCPFCKTAGCMVERKPNGEMVRL